MGAGAANRVAAPNLAGTTAALGAVHRWLVQSVSAASAPRVSQPGRLWAGAPARCL